MVTRQLVAAARGVSQSHAHRPSEFPVPTMKSTALLTLARRRGDSASRWRAASANPAAAAADRRQRPRSAARAAATPPRFAVPPFIALSTDAETTAIARDDRRRPLGRPQLRARVRAHPARRLRDDSRREIARRRAVRPLARAQRRRRHRRHGAEDRQRLSNPGAAVRRPADSGRSSARSTADRRERARCTRTRSPTRSICSSAPCAASRAPSWRSIPTATASACRAPSRAAA